MIRLTLIGIWQVPSKVSRRYMGLNSIDRMGTTNETSQRSDLPGFTSICDLLAIIKSALNVRCCADHCMKEYGHDCHNV